MKSLYFLGKLPASGLLLPPIMVAQDYEPTLHILGENDSERILRMKTGLAHLHSGETVQVAHDEIALTLLAFRASRLAGVHVFEATAALLYSRA